MNAIKQAVRQNYASRFNDVFLLGEHEDWLVLELDGEVHFIWCAVKEAGTKLVPPSRQEAEKASVEWLVDNTELIDNNQPVKFDLAVVSLTGNTAGKAILCCVSCGNDWPKEV